MRLENKGERAMFALVLIAICIVMGAVGQILMKNGMSQVGQIGGWNKLLDPGIFANIFTNYFVIGGLVLYAISAFLWLGALSSRSISFLYPMLSLAYVLTAILGSVFLKESISLLRWLGIGLVIIGCYMIFRS